MKKILILNGPNLNMLGLREPDIYGRETLKDIEKLCNKTARDLALKIDFRQSNHEGELVGWIQESAPQQNKSAKFDGVIINAAAYTHTSVAIHDALKLLNVPVIEVHISNPKTREKFRRHSYIEPLATKAIVGKGAKGYSLALTAMHKLISH